MSDKYVPKTTKEGLERQVRELIVLCQSMERQRDYYKGLCENLTDELSTFGKGLRRAEWEINNLLSKKLDELEADNARLRIAHNKVELDGTPIVKRIIGVGEKDFFGNDLKWDEKTFAELVKDSEDRVREGMSFVNGAWVRL